MMRQTRVKTREKGPGNPRKSPKNMRNKQRNWEKGRNTEIDTEGIKIRERLKQTREGRQRKGR